MKQPLNILRRMPPRIDGEEVTLGEFFRRSAEWKSSGAQFGSWTARRPRRAEELVGGSVYFVYKGETRFRMPLAWTGKVRDFKPDAPEHWLDEIALVCHPEIIEVDRMAVKFLRGWRYLEANVAPFDLSAVCCRCNERKSVTEMTAFYAGKNSESRTGLLYECNDPYCEIPF